MRLLVSSALIALLSLTACKGDQPKAPEQTAAQTDTAQAQAPKADEPKADEAKADEAKADEAKADEAKADEAKPTEVQAEPKPNQANAPLSDEQNAAIEAGLTAFEALGKLMATHASDCAKLAAELTTFGEKNKTVIETFQKVVDGIDAEASPEVAQRIQARMEASMAGFAAAEACQNDPNFLAAIMALSGAPDVPSELPEMPDLENLKAETPVIAKLAEIVSGAGDDCSKLGKDLAAFGADDIEALKSFLGKLEGQQQPQINGDMVALMQTVPRLQACESEPAIQALKQAFTGEGAK